MQTLFRPCLRLGRYFYGIFTLPVLLQYVAVALPVVGRPRWASTVGVTRQIEAVRTFQSRWPPAPHQALTLAFLHDIVWEQRAEHCVISCTLRAAEAVCASPPSAQHEMTKVEAAAEPKPSA